MTSEIARRALNAFAMIATLTGAPLSAPAFAGTLQVTPTRLGLAPGAPTTVLTAANIDTDEASYQLQVFAWSQDADGTDRLDPTRDVLGNPGIFTLKPQDQQVIRLGLRTGTLPAERTYRVIIQELPKAQEERPNGVIATLLRVSVPLFIPTAAPVPAMRWALQTGPKGMSLVAQNTGNVHVQIRSAEISAPGGVSKTNISIYVLPGVTRTIRLNTSGATGTTYHVHIDTDQGAMSADLQAARNARPAG